MYKKNYLLRGYQKDRQFDVNKKSLTHQQPNSLLGFYSKVVFYSEFKFFGTLIELAGDIMTLIGKKDFSVIMAHKMVHCQNKQ